MAKFYNIEIEEILQKVVKVKAKRNANIQERWLQYIRRQKI